MARLLKAGKSAIRKLMAGGGRQGGTGEAQMAAPGAAPFAGLETSGDTPEALRAELEELRALLDQMRAERSRKAA